MIFNMNAVHTVVIGGGLTGLTTAYLLKKKNINVILIEKESQVGGAIKTYNQEGYIFESGPNTGAVSNPEVSELFELLNLEIEEANPDAEKRLILKNSKWHALPDGPITFFRTPLFSTIDKIGIALEPFKSRGKNPEESVASLASRRIGKSFVDYAVNPFLSGIYAGDPEKLITKYALPKLYNLEQNYGSFIGGAFKKSREPKTERDKKATRKVFSVEGGLSTLIRELEKGVGKDDIIYGAKEVKVVKRDSGYEVQYMQNGKLHKINTPNVISTIGAYSLPDVFPFLGENDLDKLSTINYAKMIEVSVALRQGALKPKYHSFGGLIPQKENRKILGILFPSVCFPNRAPKGGDTLAVYMGGIKKPQMYDLSDSELNNIVEHELKDLFDISPAEILFTKIFRHPYAIPQYEKSSGERFETIERIQKENPGLIIAGNLRDGIGMSDRIKQAFAISEFYDKE